MKYAQRSTAAIAAATLIGAGGIAAAATGVDARSEASPSDSTKVIDKSQRATLSALLNDLAGSRARLDARLLKAQRDLARQSRELHRQRALSRVPIAGTADPTGSEPTKLGPGSAANGSANGSLNPSSRPAPPPPTHTSTGASGGNSGGDSDDHEEDGGDDMSAAAADDD
jgi:hypothetical protein